MLFIENCMPMLVQTIFLRGGPKKNGAGGVNQNRRDGKKWGTNERPGTDHLTSGPMRGLQKQERTHP